MNVTPSIERLVVAVALLGISLLLIARGDTTLGLILAGGVASGYGFLRVWNSRHKE